MSTLAEAYKATLFEIFHAPQNRIGDYSIYELNNKEITWDNDTLNKFKFVKKGIDHIDYTGGSPGYQRVIDYNTSTYAKLKETTTPHTVPLRASFDTFWNVITELDDAANIDSWEQLEVLDENGIAVPAWKLISGSPLALPGSPAGSPVGSPPGSPAGSPPEEAPEEPIFEPILDRPEVESTDYWLIRDINVLEQAYITELNNNYNRYMIAQFLWYLAGKQESTFMTKFVDWIYPELTITGNEVSNLGHKVFRENNGAEFEDSYTSLISHTGPNYDFINFYGNNLLEFIKTKPSTISTKWRIKREGNSYPKLSLDVYYGHCDLLLAFQYDSLFWSWIHLQMYHILKETYGNLMPGQITVSAESFTWYTEETRWRKFKNLFEYQIFNIEQEEIDYSKIINIERDMPILRNKRFIDSLYNLFKSVDDINNITDYNSYYQLIFKILED